MGNTDFFKQPTHPRLTQAPPNSLPKYIGPYRVNTLLKRGGMSYLYKATHPDSGEPVAIKVLSEKYLSRPDVVQRFLNEAEIISMTNHPNIVKMYSHGEWEGGLYIAMECVEGISLREYLSSNPITLKKALSFIIEIAYALCHLHAHGVIHRDLKPENILITPDGSIKVIDFGIAQLLTDQPVETSQRQMLIGTPLYISPEQKDSPETVSFPSDIYSLAIMTYELVVGKLQSNQIELSLTPKGLQPILTKALQPDPKNRYHDIVDFITELAAYMNSPTILTDRKTEDALGEIAEQLNLLRLSLLDPTPTNTLSMEYVQFKGKETPVHYLDLFNQSILIALASEETTFWTTHKIDLIRIALKSFTLENLSLETLLKDLHTLIQQEAALTPVHLVAIDFQNAQLAVMGNGSVWNWDQKKWNELAVSNTPPIGEEFTYMPIHINLKEPLIFTPSAHPFFHDKLSDFLKKQGPITSNFRSLFNELQFDRGALLVILNS